MHGIVVQKVYERRAESKNGKADEALHLRQSPVAPGANLRVREQYFGTNQDCHVAFDPLFL